MAKILDIDYFIPDDKITNEFLSKKFPKWNPESIFNKTGIKQRGKSSEDITAGDLAILASEKLFKKTIITKNKIDFLIFVTQTPNQCLPSTSCEIHEAIGLNQGCGALDVNQGCSGYIYGLNLASSLIDSGSAKYVLLLTGDTYTKLMDSNDPSVVPLFGDGASASIIGPETNTCNQSSIGKFEFGTDGSKASYLNCDFGGFRKTQINWKKLYMNGPGIMSFTLEVVPKAIDNYLKKNHLTKDEIDLLILHQANKFILDRLHNKTNFKEKGVICLEDYGNTVSSTIPIALVENVFLKLKKNMKILLVGYGVGLSWGITCIEV